MRGRARRVGVKDIDDGIFADGEHHAVGSLGAAVLVEVGFELFRLSPQFDGLAQKPTLDHNIRLRLA